MTKPRTVFITGATGGLGRELVRTFIEETGDLLLLLVRPKGSVSHEERVKKLFNKMGINGKSEGRIQILAGDVTQPRLGLSGEDWRKVTRETDEIFHSAALTHLGASWEEAEKINLQGTLHVLEAAKEASFEGRLKRFFYFSTAYVAGSLTPLHALEDELAENPKFGNAYEATKFLAEKEVREEAAAGLPTTIFRPSIVVGDSRNGAVSEFNVIYPFFRLFVHGFLKRIPSRLENSFNIVPIDFVVRASFLLSRQEGTLGKTFHLVSEKPPTLRMLLEMKEEKEYESFPPVEVIDPDRFSIESLEPSEREVFSTLKPYLGYLGSSLTFDTANARKALQDSGVDFPQTDLAFLRKIVDYALEKGYFVRR